MALSALSPRHPACPGDEDAFGGPRPASVPEFAHVELLPKQLVKQQGNKT